MFSPKIPYYYGLHRPMLAIVAMRGMSISAAAILAATLRTSIVMFGWYVNYSAFFFCDDLILS